MVFFLATSHFPSKIQLLHVGRGNPQHPYTLSSLPLCAVSQVRDLGFIVDKYLTFSSHCKHISSKAFQVSHMILRALQSSHLPSLLSAYRIYVRPILESGTTVFSPYLKTDVQQLERVQNYFTRRIYNRAFKISRPLLPTSKIRNQTLSLQALKNRRDNRDLIILYRLVYGHLRISDKTPHYYSIKPSSLRGPGFTLSVPFARQNYRKFSFFSRSARAFLAQSKASTSHKDLLHKLHLLFSELRISWVSFNQFYNFRTRSLHVSCLIIVLHRVLRLQTYQSIYLLARRSPLSALKVTNHLRESRERERSIAGAGDVSERGLKEKIVRYFGNCKEHSLWNSEFLS